MDINDIDAFGERGLHDLALGELMTMQTQVASISMGRGMDSKSDPKITARPVLLQNGIFTAPGQIAKRNGYDSMTNALIGGGTWSSPTMVRAYNNELLLAATTSNGQRLLSYSQDLEAWLDCGQYQSVAVSRTLVTGQAFTESASGNDINAAGVNSSAAVIGNLALFAFDYGSTYGEASSGQPYPNATFISVVDIESGLILANNITIPNALGFSKAIVLGPSTFAVSYITSTTSNSLAFRIVTVSSGGVSVGSEVSVGNCSSGLSPRFPYCYDYTPAASGGGVFALAHISASEVSVYQYSSSGSLVTSANLSGGGTNISPVSINQDPSGNFWIYWNNQGTLKYAVLNSSLGSVLGVTTITTGLANVMQIAASPASTTQTVYYSTYAYPSYAVGGIYSTINSATVNSSGTIVSAAGVYQEGYDIYGKPFVMNSRNYLPAVSLSYGNGATGFILDIANNLPVAKFLQTEAEGLYTAGSTSGGSYTSPILSGVRYPGLINSVFSLSNTLVFFPASQVLATQPYLIDLSASVSNLDANAVETQISINMKPCYLQFDFDNIDANQSIIQQDTVVLNGGVLSMYDGAECTELQFLADPDNLVIKGSTTGGSYATGTLSYCATYEWTDANGNLYESAPSPQASIKFTTGSTNSVTGAVSMYVGAKQNVTIKIWRSDSNEGGNLSYLVVAIPNNGGGNAYVAFTDEFSSGSAAIQPTLYTQAGAILDNLSPPPAMILWTNNNRLWCVDSENPNTTIEYSKTAAPGYGISFSTGLLELLIDSQGGPIRGGFRMDEKTVIGKQSGIGYFTGDGANDAGSGTSFSNFQFIPSDVGWVNSKSAASFPLGILFKSDKGIYLVSRGLQISYFGMDVEAFNSQDVQSVQLVDSKNQLRFLTSDGSSLLYDYNLQLWSVFTNHAGLSADVWDGSYVYVRSPNNAQDNGALFIEDEDSFLDNATAYALSVQLQWLKASIPQGYQRLRRTILLGDYENGSNAGHGVQIQAAYDFQPSFSAAIGYTFGAANASGVFQYREDLPQQLCDAIQLLITEVTTGASGEYMDLTDLGIEIGSHRGLNRLPALQSA